MGKKKRKTQTKKQQKEEIIKCGTDVVYFLKNYAKISHPQLGQIPFDTFDYQDDLLEKFQHYQYNIILKARQQGISTIVAGYIAWLCLFHKHKEVIVLATKQLKAANIVRKVSMILKNLPPWLQISKIVIDNKNGLELSNGSRIGAESTAKDAGRSDSLSLLVVDEAAHVDNMNHIWEAAYPAISAGGKIIALSTPLGTGTWFHETCVNAKSGANDFVMTTLLWDVHPERDDEWFRDQTKNMDARSVAQEFLCSFNASGDTVISPESLDELRKSVKEPMYKIGIDRNYWIWEEMRPDGKYLISCDVARGDGEDYSAISVQEMQDMKRVAEYKGKQDRDLFVQMIQKVAREYGNPLQIVEVNNIGISVAEDLYETGYENLYFCKKGSQEYIDPIQAIGNSNAVPGFTTTQKNRTLIIAKLEEYIRNGDLINYSERFLDELSTFIWKNGRPEAQKGYNDDLIMSMAIACWVRDTAQVKGTREAAYNSAQLDAIVFTRKEFTSGFPGERNIYHSGRRLEAEIDEMKKRVPLIFLG